MQSSPGAGNLLCQNEGGCKQNIQACTVFITIFAFQAGKENEKAGNRSKVVYILIII